MNIEPSLEHVKAPAWTAGALTLPLAGVRRELPQ